MLGPVIVAAKNKRCGASCMNLSSVLISGLQSQAPLPSG